MKKLENVLIADIQIDKKVFEEAKNMLSEYIQFHEIHAKDRLIKKIFCKGIHYGICELAEKTLAKLLEFDKVLESNIFTAKLDKDTINIEYEDENFKLGVCNLPYKNIGSFTNIEKMKVKISLTKELENRDIYVSSMHQYLRCCRENHVDPVRNFDSRPVIYIEVSVPYKHANYE